MKASESIPNFAPKLREYANFSYRTIKKICTEIGPRECGTDAELKAQEFMAKQVGSAADEVKTEEFEVHPRAFFGWMKIDGVALILSALLFLADNLLNRFEIIQSPILQYISFALAILSAVVLAGEFLFYKEFIDFLWPKAVSHNTFCVRKPVGEVKRRIIFAGHSDSSLEWRFTHLGGAPVLYASLIYPAVGLGYFVVMGILNLCGLDLSPVFSYVGLVFIPGFCFLLVFLNSKICVDGANDNLTGCMMGASVLKYMEDNALRFENTEVVAMFSGGEESGLRGAKAAAKAHLQEYKEVETVFIGMDTFRDYEDMAVYNRDMSGLTKHDEKVTALVRKAASFAGRELKTANLYCGASDAAAMTQAGIPSVCLAAMNPGPPKYYHTRDDRADNMNLKCIENGIQISLEIAFLYDEQGLRESYD